MNIDVGSILGRAWRITWNNKILWLFGILATLAGGGGSNTNFRFNVGGGGGGQPGGPGGPMPEWMREFERFFNQLDPNVVWIVALSLACLGLILTIVFIVLAVFGRGGLIGGVQIAEREGRVSFGEAWAVGRRHFWTLLAIIVVVFLLTLVVTLVTVVPGVVLAVATFGLGLLCLLPVICLLAILAIAVNIVAYFAQIAAVVENLSFGPAIRRAWQIITNNFVSILVLGLITIVIGVIVNTVLLIPFGLVLAPFIVGVVALASGEAPRVGMGAVALGGLCLIVFIPVLLVLRGILESWFTAVWTLAYEQFTGLGRPSVPPAPPAPAMPGGFTPA